MNSFGLVGTGVIAWLGLVGSGCAGQESPAGNTRVDGGGGRDGGDAGDGECTSPAAAFDCSDGYAEGDGGVCGKTVSAAICVNGAFVCPIGTIPTSQCTAEKCPSALPSGACHGNESFSCVGWVYPFVSVSCLCISGTWSCQL